ncbi:MAG: hypothetical protein QNJ51_17940 [Calothrix sp. MO_167.B12]|nr:hypothetical protein [Calothrix sp. MO_167.B12]
MILYKIYKWKPIQKTSRRRFFPEKYVMNRTKSPAIAVMVIDEAWARGLQHFTV